MTISVENTLAIVVNQLIFALPKLASAFAILYIGGWFVLAAAANQGAASPYWLPTVLAVFAAVAYALKEGIDAYLHSQKTQLELTKNNITCTVSGFSTRTFSIPLSQVSSVHVQQGFIDRLFNVSQVVVVQIASTVAIYGFDYDQAVAFSKAFSQIQATSKRS